MDGRVEPGHDEWEGDPARAKVGEMRLTDFLPNPKHWGKAMALGVHPDEPGQRRFAGIPDLYCACIHTLCPGQTGWAFEFNRIFRKG